MAILCVLTYQIFLLFYLLAVWPQNHLRSNLTTYYNYNCWLPAITNAIKPSCKWRICGCSLERLYSTSRWPQKYFPNGYHSKITVNIWADKVNHLCTVVTTLFPSWRARFDSCDLTDIKKGVCRLSKLVNKWWPATGQFCWHDTELGMSGGDTCSQTFQLCCT